MKHRKIFFLLFTNGLLMFLLSGCMSAHRYTYAQIIKPHARENPVGSPESPPPPKPDLFSLSKPLSLAQAVRLALTHNPNMDMALARIRQSEALIDEALAAFWPRVTLSAEYLQGNAPSAYLFKTIDQRQLPPGVNFNDPGWFENFEVGLQGRLNLFRGGRDFLRKKMAETGLAIHQLGRLRVQNALVESVIRMYFNTLAAQDFIRIARQSVDTVSTELRIMKVRYGAGGTLKSDVLSLDVRLAQAREDLVRAENNRDLSKASMANLLGADPDTPIMILEEEQAPLDVPEHYASGLVYALANRAELEKARHQVVQSKIGLDMARAAYLPSLDAQARYYLDDSDFDFQTSRDNWTTAVMLNWDLFSGLGKRERVKYRKRILEEMLAADREAILSVQLDLKTAYLKFEEAKARLAVSKASVEQAEESLSLVKKQYEGGSATITRYLDAELARNRARIRSTAAFYDREKAKAAVGRALGYWGQYATGVLTGEAP